MDKTFFTLVWVASEFDGGSEITEYIVEIKETSSNKWHTVGSSSGNTTNLLIEKLTTNKSYDFRISACNEAGQSEPLLSENGIIVGQGISKFRIILFHYLISNTKLLLSALCSNNIESLQPLLFIEGSFNYKY